MSQFLQDFAAFLRQNQQNIYAIGEYRPGSAPERVEIEMANACNNIYSVSKVFTVTAIGMLWDEGKLRTDETVGDILREELPTGYDEHWDCTTVDMLLRHRVGLPGGALDIDCLDAARFDPDYLAEVVKLPWSCEPDTQRIYTDAAYYVLSRIAAKRAGEPMQNFLWKRLFLPLGFREAAWSTCPKGHAMGATGLYIRAEDLVKLGGVYLQKGLWNGQRILSEAWVATVLERGYELRLNSETGAYSKGGMLGQNLMIIPKQNRAVCWIGHRRGPGADFEKFIFSYPD